MVHCRGSPRPECSGASASTLGCGVGSASRPPIRQRVSHLASDRCGQVPLSHLGGSSTWPLCWRLFTGLKCLWMRRPMAQRRRPHVRQVLPAPGARSREAAAEQGFSVTWRTLEQGRHADLPHARRWRHRSAWKQILAPPLSAAASGRRREARRRRAGPRSMKGTAVYATSTALVCQATCLPREPER